ncbi:hypothetical protein PYR67_23930 [Rhizobium sp. BC49]|uniref:hypothetical protein n=1 Tax=Rhizobium sp. BC49 TaxID=3031127 RepID=UPI0023D7E570|nr:hypothetical protein [Rhizobium sp. BC49]MDF0662368.1 hypothetical protein [Rhizobium sp. BC49]
MNTLPLASSFPAFDDGVLAMRCRAQPETADMIIERTGARQEQTMNDDDRRVGDASLRISRNGQIRYFVPPYDAFQENPARCR